MSINNLVTPAMLQALREQIMKEQFDEQYPVGKGYYIQYSGMEEPAVYFAKYGASWTLDSAYAGRVLVGQGDGYTLGATGGSADAVIVRHYHTLAQGVPMGTSSSGNTYRLAGVASPSVSVQMKDIMASGYESGTANGVDGTGKNMQPYKVVGVWKRTA